MSKDTKNLYYSLVVTLFGVFLWTISVQAIQNQALNPIQAKIIAEARNLLETSEVSYVFGGYVLGDASECKSCNECLNLKKPAPKARLKECAVCSSCSLDCSHFVQLVFNGALQDSGIETPYLNSEGMLGYSSQTLKKRYKYIDIGRDVRRAEPGDLLVYKGHVALLEAFSSQEIVKLSQKVRKRTSSEMVIRGDIIHATGGREIRSPGAAIQRERFVDLAYFRGPVQRILRHQVFYQK